MGHHEEADGLHAELLGDLDVLLGDVRLGAVHRDAGDGDTELAHLAQVVGQADPGEHEAGDLRLLGGLARLRDQLLLGHGGEAVVEAGATKAVTMGDLDDLHARAIEALDDLDDVLGVVLVATGVRSVTQGRVDEAVIGAGHALTPRCSATASPTRMAAAVMMSRLPA